MTINLSQTPLYYQTTFNNTKRQLHIEEEFCEFDIRPVYAPVAIAHKGEYTGTERLRSGGLAHMRIIDIALRRQWQKNIDDKKNKDSKIYKTRREWGFEPFILLEDDVSKYRTFPKNIQVPDDADIVYIGISTASVRDEYPYYVYKNYGKKMIHVPDIIRIYHMLSTYGLLYCSLRACTAVSNAMYECIANKLAWDVVSAKIQEVLNVYAFKEPLVYQDARYGGQEVQTKFLLTKVFSPRDIKKSETVTHHCLDTYVK